MDITKGSSLFSNVLFKFTNEPPQVSGNFKRPEQDVVRVDQDVTEAGVRRRASQGRSVRKCPSKQIILVLWKMPSLQRVWCDSVVSMLFTFCFFTFYNCNNNKERKKGWLIKKSHPWNVKYIAGSRISVLLHCRSTVVSGSSFDTATYVDILIH